MVRQCELYWVNLDPTIGKEIQKVRPCVVISPDELNSGLSTVLISPITGTLRDYPFRVSCRIKEKDGSIALDQTRCVDKRRLGKKIGILSKAEILDIKEILLEMLIK
jgi:mRNA interferase MazF